MSLLTSMNFRVDWLRALACLCLGFALLPLARAEDHGLRAVVEETLRKLDKRVPLAGKHVYVAPDAIIYAADPRLHLRLQDELGRICREVLRDALSTTSSSTPNLDERFSLRGSLARMSGGWQLTLTLVQVATRPGQKAQILATEQLPLPSFRTEWVAIDGEAITRSLARQMLTACVHVREPLSATIASLSACDSAPQPELESALSRSLEKSLQEQGLFIFKGSESSSYQLSLCYSIIGEEALRISLLLKDPDARQVAKAALELSLDPRSEVTIARGLVAAAKRNITAYRLQVLEELQGVPIAQAAKDHLFASLESAWAQVAAAIRWERLPGDPGQRQVNLAVYLFPPEGPQQRSGIQKQRIRVRAVLSEVSGRQETMLHSESIVEETYVNAGRLKPDDFDEELLRSVSASVVAKFLPRLAKLDPSAVAASSTEPPVR